MTMKNKIKEFLDERGITPYQFWKQTNVAQRTAYDLYNNPEQYPSREVMDKICSTYQVQPGDLLEWVPGDIPSDIAVEATSEQKPARRGKGRSEPKNEPLAFVPGQLVKIPNGARAWVDKVLENGRVALTVEGVGEDEYPAHMLTVTDLVV